ncbi:hypothetical protein KEM55_008566, partial [Ascosphaera atra]
MFSGRLAQAIPRIRGHIPCFVRPAPAPARYWHIPPPRVAFIATTSTPAIARTPPQLHNQRESSTRMTQIRSTSSVVPVAKMADKVDFKAQARDFLSFVNASPTLSKKSGDGFVQVGVEAYGGGIWHSWFDRDLGLAGRAMVREADGSIRARLVRIHRP